MKLHKKIFQNDFVIKILGKIIAGYMQLCFKTSRWKFIGLDIPEEYIASKQSLLMALWHDRLMTAPCAWKWATPLHVLSSAHRDGKLIAEIVRNLKMIPIYGSTGKCSLSSLKEMLSICNNGNCLAIIPDGPRGPRHTVSSGILEIARITKTDIIPFSCCVKNFKQCSSWDKFIITYPFNRGVIICGEPLKYTDIAEKTTAECQQILKQKLDNLAARARLELDS